MPNNLSLCIEFIAVVVIVRFLTDFVPVRCRAFLFNENAPNARGIAYEENRTIIQKKPDTGNIETLDFILEVLRVIETNTIVAVTVYLDHSVCSSI
jgi:hypothetical protein